MTVLKATFRTNNAEGRIEINLTWHKCLPGYGGLSGYVVTENDRPYLEARDINEALSAAVRLFKQYEKESHERATAQSKTT